MKNRQEFLKKGWDPYPPLTSSPLELAEIKKIQPVPALLVGFVSQITEKTIELQRNSCRLEVSSLQAVMEDQRSSSARPQDVLIPGDTVAISCRELISSGIYSAEKVQLLTPRLSPVPLSSQRKCPKTAKQWPHFVGSIRNYFEKKNFLEVQTPFLVRCPGTEPHLEPVQVSPLVSSRNMALFLPTSPEIHLKKILSQGYDKIYEIKTVFRDEPVSPHHQPEFSMLEWYRSFNCLAAIEQDCQELLFHLTEQLESPSTEKTDLSIRRKSFQELFHSQLQFDLRPDTTYEQLVQLCCQHEIAYRNDDSWDDLFFRIFLEKIEPQIDTSQPLLLHDFPPSQAALARLNSEGWADRFELYWRGLEIANAFHELNDPEEQRRRLSSDIEQREALGVKPVPRDEEFLACLESGLPPSAGIALGVDRLFMAFHNYGDLAVTRFFPHPMT